ncbi:TlpA family protein disulfide reductase [Arachidicoccus soli]|nr:hypothetical protein [Arachidicoccus soli]
MKKTIFLVMGLLCLASTGFGQTEKEIKPLYIDGVLPNLTFHNIINYKDSIATLSDFQGPQYKLVVFDFWSTHCTVCIGQFLKDDSLQRAYKNDLQIVLVTDQPKQLISNFIAKWEAGHHVKLSIPIIVADTLLPKYIRRYFEPNYAWIAPDNRMIAQTSENFVNQQTIETLLKEMEKLKAEESIAIKAIHTAPAAKSHTIKQLPQ